MLKVVTYFNQVAFITNKHEIWRDTKKGEYLMIG